MSTNPKPGRIIVDEVIDAVLTHYSVLEAPINRADLIGKDRTSYVHRVRAMTMYALKTRLEMSYPEVGRVMERDHTSVLAACRRVQQDFDQEEVAELLHYVDVRLRRQRGALREALLAEVGA